MKVVTYKIKLINNHHKPFPVDIGYVVTYMNDYDKEVVMVKDIVDYQHLESDEHILWASTALKYKEDDQLTTNFILDNHHIALSNRPPNKRIQLKNYPPFF